MSNSCFLSLLRLFIVANKQPEHCPESAFLLTTIQARPQHSTVLERESQHVFLCIKVLVGKASYIQCQENMRVFREEKQPTPTPLCVLDLPVYTLVRVPDPFHCVRNNNRSNSKLSKQICGVIMLLMCSTSHSLPVCLSVCRSNRHSVGVPQIGSPGCPRGGSLTNGELHEEQIPGSGLSGRRRSSKSHSSPGSGAGIHTQTWL